MKEKISDNTEVLIFDSKRYSINVLNTKFKRGVIISSVESDDLSCYVSPWTERIYYVKGEDGRLYTGTYENPVIGSHYFMTEEDYNKKIKNVIMMNNSKKCIEKNNIKSENVFDSLGERQPKEVSKQLKKTKY